MAQGTLYDEAVEVSRNFLGPAGERFLRRQISTHLEIEPEDLRSEHLEELVSWVKLTFAVLTNDTQLVKDFAGQLLSLSDHPPAESAREAHAGAR